MFSRSLRLPLKFSYSGISRWQSSAVASDLIQVDVNEKTGISKVSLNNKPVNSLTLDLLKEFCAKMDSLEKEKVKGMILTSSAKKVFSAGLDFSEITKPDETRLHGYWFWFQEAWIKLYGSSFGTAALINGHAPAGGCVLALSCEYRVMLPNFTIGLNEAPVGIVIPNYIVGITRNTISSRQAELMLTTGKLFKTDEAFKIGLIDEIAENEEDATTRCEKFLQKCAKVPATARHLTKENYRRETLKILKNPKSRAANAKSFVDHLLLASTQQDMENYVESIKKK